jgi:hypothetical protein
MMHSYRRLKVAVLVLGLAHILLILIYRPYVLTKSFGQDKYRDASCIAYVLRSSRIPTEVADAGPSYSPATFWITLVVIVFFTLGSFDFPITKSPPNRPEDRADPMGFLLMGLAIFILWGLFCLIEASGHPPYFVVCSGGGM